MYLEHALKGPSLLRHQAYIGGEWQAADSDATFEVFGPATEESLGTVPKMGAAETARAIDAAQTAWAGWRLLMAQSAPTVKKLTLELGGNAPFIVFDDADLDAAVEGAIASKYRNNGQTCVCTNRFFVHERVYDAFADKLAAAVSKLKVGRGTESGATLGPLINEAAVKKVESHIADALAKGASLMTGGKRHALGHGFFEPTVLTGVKPDMDVAKEETFGPLAPLFRFAVPVCVGGRIGAPCQRYGVRPCRLFLQSRYRSSLARCRGPRIRHGRDQYGAHFKRSRAVRRCQAIWARPRRIALRYRRLCRDQVFVRRCLTVAKQQVVITCAVVCCGVRS